MALLFFVNGVVVGSWLPRLPEIRDRIGIDLDTLGLTLALGGLGSLVGSTVSGVVVGRFGSRRTAEVAALALFLTLPLIAAVPNASLLALVLAVQTGALVPFGSDWEPATATGSAVQAGFFAATAPLLIWTFLLMAVSWLRDRIAGEKTSFRSPGRIDGAILIGGGVVFMVVGLVVAIVLQP